MGLSSAFKAALKAALPATAVVEDPEAIAPHLREWRDRWRGEAPLMVAPAATGEVAVAVALATRYRVPIVPQGGNTGLVGGQIPRAGELLISLHRLRQRCVLDRASASLTVDAGITLAEAQAAAKEADLLLPLSLASEGSATIGGVLASNAGGVHVLRYGMARDRVIGLEAVLSGGRIWRDLGGLAKDNRGYDLRHLLLGAEGTLGIITGARLKLVPATPHRAVALVAIDEPADAMALLARARSDPDLNAFELIQGFGLELSLAQTGQTPPFPETPAWAVLIELAGRAPSVTERLTGLLEAAAETAELADAVIARSEAEAGRLWALRDSLSEAQKRAGASLKHDIALPADALAAFIAETVPALQAACPQIRPCIFGHAGDGNLHFNLSRPEAMSDADFLARRQELEGLVHDRVIAQGGSIAAEHGLGVMKAELYRQSADPVRYGAEQAIRRALDPLGLFNPERKILL